MMRGGAVQRTHHTLLANDTMLPVARASWTMTGTHGSAASKRSLVGLSSSSAILASAARRRANGLDLDRREEQALKNMRDELEGVVTSLRAGKVTASSPEETYAFAQLASALSQTSRTPESRPNRDELAAVLGDVVQQLTVLIVWEAPDFDAAKVVASLFQDLSRNLLNSISRPGETLGTPFSSR
jgi:hypothetical protein